MNKKIVLTGGPGGGKTTALDLLRREIGEQVVIVPEAATILFNGGFPRSDKNHAKVSLQKSIYHVQKNLEDVQACLYPDRILLCDRGTLDSSVYWPHGDGDFYKNLDTTFENELNRYDGVIFFETAAKGNISIEGGNPNRVETLNEALDIDKRLQDAWSKHHNYHFIGHEKSFMHKMNKAFEVFKKILAN